MARLFIVLMSAVALFAAADPLAKLRELKSGAEIRIFKKDAKQPVNAEFHEFTGETLIVVIKTEQTSIPLADVDRMDARPVSTASRITSETKVTDHPTNEPATPVARGGATNRTTSSGVSISGKPGFETIYRRPPATK